MWTIRNYDGLQPKKLLYANWQESANNGGSGAFAVNGNVVQDLKLAGHMPAEKDAIEFLRTGQPCPFYAPSGRIFRCVKPEQLTKLTKRSQATWEKWLKD